MRSELDRLGIPLNLAPMEARLVAELPIGDSWQYEPKWDGFRCLAFRAGEEVELRAKSGKSLTRFFPEVVVNLRAMRLNHFVIDGELVIEIGKVPDFEALQMRLHPAQSRIKRLACDTPATLVAFDCLLHQLGRPLLARPFFDRRRALETVAADVGSGSGLRVTSFTRELRTAKRWLNHRHKSLDGVVAKRLDLAYLPGARAMLKVKCLRTADCVVGGFRYETGGRLVGSLLLGLYDAKGLLHHVGFTSAIPREHKPELTKRLEGLISPPGFSGDAPGGPSRWSTERSAAWQPLRPKLVVEVVYDHVTGGRSRHGTKLVRWRPEKAPIQCTCDQIGRH
jgi:ATP-dependent DNA ligase